MSAIIISAMMATELRHYRPEKQLPDSAIIQLTILLVRVLLVT